MYAFFGKRVLDLILSLVAFILLFPLLLILTVVGMAVLKGNPFFIQKRPGLIDKNTGEERIISLIKFRTMNNQRDGDGKLLSDAERLIPYGKFLRSTSLDELPSLLNIIKGDLAICGPRPLRMAYLPRYSPEQRRRHTVRPGLTGYAQAYGRNSLTWEERFEKDLYYVENLSLWLDIKIIFKTIGVVLKRESVSPESGVTMEEFMGSHSPAATE